MFEIVFALVPTIQAIHCQQSILIVFHGQNGCLVSQ
jgi:hypothetical protein